MATPCLNPNNPDILVLYPHSLARALGRRGCPVPAPRPQPTTGSHPNPPPQPTTPHPHTHTNTHTHPPSTTTATGYRASTQPTTDSRT